MSTVEPSGRAAAEQRADQIRTGLVSYVTTLETISAAYAARDWTALGYPNWDAYVAGEFAESRLKLDRDSRRQAVEALRLGGMSMPAIASALGVSVGTVHGDAQAFKTESLPGEITGADGKRYAAARPPERVSAAVDTPTDSPAGRDQETAPAAPVIATTGQPGAISDGVGTADPIDPVPAGVAEQIRDALAAKLQHRPARPDVDDPVYVERTRRETSSKGVAEGLVALYLALPHDPIAWLESTWLPDVYPLRDMPRARDAFTPSGLRATAKALDILADRLDQTGREL